MASTALLELIEKGDKEGVSELLEGGECNGCLSELNKEGRNPLDLSVVLGRSDIVSILLEKGADPTTANPSGGDHWNMLGTTSDHYGTMRSASMEKD